MLADGTQITDRRAQRAYVLAGRAIFTVWNERTDNRFTFRVRAAEPGHDGVRYFVDVLTGPDNDHDYTWLGMLFPHRANNHAPVEYRFVVPSSSSLHNDSPSAKAFRWLWHRLESPLGLPERVHLLHNGRCGRCGRTLTVPESIASGLGPVCAGKAA